MFFNSTSSLATKCSLALKLAARGEVSAAIEILSEIRWQRSLFDETLSRVQDPSALRYCSDSDLRHFEETISSARQLKADLDQLDSWIAKSFDESDFDQLMRADIGVELAIQFLLPKAWSYSSDIAFLAGSHVKTLYRSLVTQGQKKFIFLLSDSDAEAADLISYLSNDDETSSLIVSPNLLPTLRDMKALAGTSWPKVEILKPDPSVQEKDLFDKCCQLLRSACIQVTTRKWLPQQTTEQYLGNLSRMATLPSVMDCRSKIQHADILVVSPGPSLTNDLAMARKYQDQFVIIAALKAVDTLLDAGITPDFAVWQDPRDHSEFIPKHPGIKDVSLILSECCHPKFFDAPFKQHYVANDPHLRHLPTAEALHGSRRIGLTAASVSTMACIISIQLQCKSISLLGQDLNVSQGLYVANQQHASHSLENEASRDALFCEDIDGNDVETLPNYLSFIEEFKQIALANPKLRLYNCTSKGAFLKGWNHLPLEERAKIVDDYEVQSVSFDMDTDPPKGQQRVFALVAGLNELRTNLQAWFEESDKVKASLRRGLGEKNPQQDIGVIESRAKRLLANECSVLTYYCASTSQTVTDSVLNCKDLEDVNRLSLDYYLHFDRVARLLIDHCTSSITELETIKYEKF